MHHRQAGFAVTVVILVSVVALLAFLFSSAILTVSSRSAASQERNSTQALLAADSGLQTLRARASTSPYDASFGSFEYWIESNFGTLDLGDGIAATLDVVAEDADAITVQSTGTAGSATRTVVQVFEIVIGPPVPASATVPGALTSVGQIKTNSNALLVEGRDNTVSDWSYSSVQLCNALEGEYVVLAGVTYRVEGPSSCGTTMTLIEPISGLPLSPAPSGSTLVTHRPVAIAEPLTIDGGTPPTSEVEVTAGAQSLFGVGAPITIGGSGLGTVVAVEGTTLTIEWDVDVPLPQPEGAVLSRDISSGVTAAGTCNVGNKGASTFPDGCIGDVDLSNLFYKTFGIASPNTLKDYLQDQGKVITGSQVDDGPLTGITWVTNPDNNFRDQAGNGILIIENNPGQTIRLNVSNAFTGLIYVIGNADLAGNANYEGAIIVDGVANVTTDVQGTMGLNYDPLELVRALAGLEFPNPNPGGIGAAVANTWRIR